MVLLLNLLIAILSNVFSTIYKRGALESSRIFFENYTNRKMNKHYSSLIMSPAPFNICLAPFYPFLILRKNKKLNSLLNAFGFLPIMIAFYAIYIALNIALVIPFSYLKNIAALTINLLFRRSSLKSLAIVAIWMTFGIPYLVFVFLTNDLLLFHYSIF